MDNNKYRWCNNGDIGNIDAHPKKCGKHYLRQQRLQSPTNWASHQMDAGHLWIPGQINLAQSHHSRQLRGLADADWIIYPKVLPQDNQNRKGASEPNKKKCTVHQSKGSGIGNLGWKFWFLVTISGTPIESGTPIQFSIPEIPVGFFFNSNVWRVRKLEFWFAKFGIPVICLCQNSLRLIVANLYWLQSKS